MTSRSVLYFESAGVHNTSQLLRKVKKFVIEQGIQDIVIASTTGETGVKASNTFKGLNVIVVTHHSGFKEPGVQELRKGNEKKILSKGARIVTATHSLSGGERAIRKQFGTIEPLELIAQTLRILGEGTKVCVEITLMAADAGMLPIDRDIVAIAGSGRGADTALLITPANSSRLFDLKIKEIIAKPSGLQ